MIRNGIILNSDCVLVMIHNTAIPIYWKVKFPSKSFHEVVEELTPSCLRVTTPDTIDPISANLYQIVGTWRRIEWYQRVPLIKE